MKQVKIAGRPVGDGAPCFVIAEVGINHNGSVALAKKMVDAAAQAGADAVKFQAFKPEKLAAPSYAAMPVFKKYFLSKEAFAQIAQHAESKGIMFFAAVFDEQSADEMEELGVPVFKTASGDVTHLPLISHVAAKKKPLIISTGAASLKETTEAISTARKAKNNDIILLHCVAAYPADPAEANLRVIPFLKKRFGVPVGFSDHTLGLECALAAVALGANAIEKHFTLDREMEGPDQRISLEPQDLASLVSQIRNVERALGTPAKQAQKGEKPNIFPARRSLHAAREIPAGTRITAQDITIVRPGGGMPPKTIGKVVGRRAVGKIAAGEMITQRKIR